MSGGGLSGTDTSGLSKGGLWFDEKGEATTHLLQTTIDTLSYAENIPLRILGWKSLTNLSPSSLLKEEMEEKDAEQLILDYCQYWERKFRKDSVDTLQNKISITKTTPPEWISEQERKVWLSLPSNPLPIHTLFRLCKEWCWFVLIWFFANREKIEKIADNIGSTVSIPAFGMPQWELHFRWVV